MAPYNNAPESGTRNGGPATGRGAGAGALAGGALFVGLIALCALVISYNGIFRFAEYGGHEGSALAHVFPLAYTLLLIMAFWVSYVLRGAHPRDRFWVDLVLIPLLVLFAAVAMVMSNLQLIERVHQGVANVIVAVAPLAALLVAFLLWITLRAHMRSQRRGAGVRPHPVTDPTTVLRARAVPAPTKRPEDLRRDGEGEDRADHEELTTRLLRLGTDDRDPDRDDDRFRYQEPTDDRDERPGTTWARSGGEVDASGPDTAPMRREDEEPVTAPDLPRRTRAERNPIRRAADRTPVVPAAQTPTDAVPEASSPPAMALPDPRAEDVGESEEAHEGFDHEPPPGDPTSDEADAPRVVPAPEPEEPPSSETGRAPAGRPEEPPPSSVLEATAEHGPQAERERGIGPEVPSGTTGEEIPATAFWEPPEDDPDTVPRALDDYVPPVWTPPEDSSPFEREDPEPEPTPAPDHDTGPDARGPFQDHDVPPGAARPSEEPTEPVSEQGPEPDRTLSSDDGGDEDDRASEASPRRQETPRQETPPRLDKRPMVLKPPRPPMPDFAAGPPSRRVRSEPLRPDE